MDGGKAVGAAIASMLMLVATPCAAEVTGNKLAEWCRGVDAVTAPGSNMGPLGSLNAVTCVSYINGYTDGQSTLASLKFADLPYCLPAKGVPVAQLIKIVVKRLNAQPEHLHHPAQLIILSAYVDAFPCKK